MEHLDSFQRYERPITLPMAGRMGVRSYRMGLPRAHGAAALIRQQAREIDDLWDRLSRAYALVRQEFARRDDPG